MAGPGEDEEETDGARFEQELDSMFERGNDEGQKEDEED
jgi:hypothetical protein